MSRILLMGETVESETLIYFALSLKRGSNPNISPRYSADTVISPDVVSRLKALLESAHEGPRRQIEQMDF